MPRFDSRNGDLFRFVDHDLQTLLTYDYDQLHEFCAANWEKLGMSREALEERLDELRTFFLLTIIASRRNLCVPGRAPHEPPPKLLVVWKALYEWKPEGIEMHRFRLAFNIPQGMIFQYAYPAEKRYDASTGRVLISAGKLFGVLAREELWSC